MTDFTTSKGEIISTDKADPAVIKGLENDISIYVDSSSDWENADGSEAHPFRYVQDALDSLPDFINVTVSIYLAPGYYFTQLGSPSYPVNSWYKQFGGTGTIHFIGEYPDTPSDPYEWEVGLNLSAYNINMNLMFSSLFVNGRPMIENCRMIKFSQCLFKDYGVYITANSFAVIENSYLINAYAGIHSDNMSKVIVYTTAGSGNQYRYTASRLGQIVANYTGHTAANADNAETGGQIIIM